jgi:TolB protein
MNLDGSDEQALTGVVMSRFYHRASPKLDEKRNAVVYTRLKSGKPELEVMNLADGTTLTIGPGESSAWSPDGTAISFVVGERGAGSLWLSKPDGTNRRALTEGTSDREPAWAPDGKHIVFSRQVSDVSDLFVLDTTTGQVQNLTNSPQVGERNAAWSPDGNMIAYVAKTGDTPNGWERSVFVIPATGGPARQVSSSQFNDTTPSWLGSPAK